LVETIFERSVECSMEEGEESEHRAWVSNEEFRNQISHR